MARQYKLAVTTSPQSFGDTTQGKKRDFIFQNLSTSANAVWIDCNGNTATADIGFLLEPGKDVSSKDLPEFFRQGPYSAVSDGTATLYVQFANERG